MMKHSIDTTPKAIGAFIAKHITPKNGAGNRYPRDILCEMLMISESELEQIEIGQKALSIEQTIDAIEHLGFSVRTVRHQKKAQTKIYYQ